MFITFEGLEGAGKSTQLKEMEKILQAAGIPVLLTREPGGTRLGEEIRAALLSHREEGITPLAELLLMFAARVEHVQTVILPALNAGKWVICDRFVDASYAYQGGGRGIEEAKIEALQDLALGAFKPDYTVIFDAPVEVGLARMRARAAPDRFEQEANSFFQRARNTYLKRAKQDPLRYKVIEASKPAHLVTADLMNWIKPLLPL